MNTDEHEELADDRQQSWGRMRERGLTRIKREFKGSKTGNFYHGWTRMGENALTLIARIKRELKTKKEILTATCTKYANLERVKLLLCYIVASGGGSGVKGRA